MFPCRKRNVNTPKKPNVLNTYVHHTLHLLEYFQKIFLSIIENINFREYDES